MNKVIEFIKTSGVYFIGSVLNKLSIVILVPLYTNKISPNDYGTYDLTMTYVTLLTSIIFIDIWTVIMREMLGVNKERDKEKFLTNGFIVFLGCSVLYTVLVFVFQQVFPIKYIILVYIYGILVCLQNVYSASIRGFDLNKVYIISGISNTLITLSLNLIFLNIFSLGYESLYIAAIIGEFSQIIIIELKGKLLKKISLKHFDYAVVKKMFLIALPLGLNSGFYWILFNYNRILISVTLGTYENGLYAIGTKFSSILSLVTTCFSLAWQEMAFKNDEGNNELYTKASNLYINMLLTGVILSLPLISIVFPIMVGNEYSMAKNIVPWSILASVMSIFSSFLSTIFGAIRDYKSIMIATSIGSVVNIIVVHSLIGKVGVNAASIAIFIGFLVNVIVRVYILRRRINMRIDLKKILKYIPIILGVSYVYLNRGMVANGILLILSLGFILYIMRKEIIFIGKKIMKKVGRSKEEEYFEEGC